MVVVVVMVVITLRFLDCSETMGETGCLRVDIITIIYKIKCRKLNEMLDEMGGGKHVAGSWIVQKIYWRFYRFCNGKACQNRGY
jgi:hypothetical protein